MVIGLSIFKINPGLSRLEIEELFNVNIKNWEACPDLVSKQYFFSFENAEAGGIYRWKNIEDAKKWLGEDYKKMIKDVYGSVPKINFYIESFMVENIN